MLLQFETFVSATTLTDWQVFTGEYNATITSIYIYLTNTVCVWPSYRILLNGVDTTISSSLNLFSFSLARLHKSGLSALGKSTCSSLKPEIHQK
uniref:Uncharacterized protein n=1 Tax=Solanum tuberosum TaxID=4113 RepID=M1C499_SOLTU